MEGVSEEGKCFTVHQDRFDGLDAGHDFCQVSEGGIGTRQHLEDKYKHCRND